jgi:hypothetical protein
MTWRYALPGIVATGIGIDFFQINSNGMVLSYQVWLENLTLTNGVLQFNPKGSNSDINQIGFMVILITEDLPYL